MILRTVSQTKPDIQSSERLWRPVCLAIVPYRSDGFASVTAKYGAFKASWARPIRACRPFSMRDAAMVTRVQHGIALGIGDALWWSLGGIPHPCAGPGLPSAAHGLWAVRCDGPQALRDAAGRRCGTGPCASVKVENRGVGERSDACHADKPDVRSGRRMTQIKVSWDHSTPSNRAALFVNRPVKPLFYAGFYG